VSFAAPLDQPFGGRVIKRQSAQFISNAFCCKILINGDALMPTKSAAAIAEKAEAAPAGAA
jgi:hypothetical protein